MSHDAPAYLSECAASPGMRGGLAVAGRIAREQRRGDRPQEQRLADDVDEALQDQQRALRPHQAAPICSNERQELHALAQVGSELFR